MGLLDSVFHKVRDLFNNDSDELLIFVLVFLYLLISTNDDRSGENELQDSGSTLFFMVFLLLLFFTEGSSERNPQLQNSA